MSCLHRRSLPGKEFCCVVFILASIALCGLVTGVGAVNDSNNQTRAKRASCGNGVSWSISSNGVLSITGNGAMEACIEDFAPWYEHMSEITSISIGSGVTTIAESAFSEMYAATSVTISSTSITSIPDYAFMICMSLTSIKIPASVKSIGKSAFMSCQALKSITFQGSKLESIGDGAFDDCESLTQISFPSSLKTLGSEVFSRCYGLKTVTIPSKVNSIGDDAFVSCSSLTTINVDSSNSYYSSTNGILFNKDKTSLIVFPQGKSDNTYTIPDSVTSIASYAFYSCSNLTSITVPSSVASITGNAFSGCDYLRTIDVNSNNLYYKSVNGILFDAESTTLVYYPAAKSGSSYIIPTTVTSIGGGAFSSNRYLTEVTIPDSVVSISSYSFSSCAKLVTVYYVGAKAISTSDVFKKNSLTNLCVQPDYPSSTFCSYSVTSTTQKCKTFRNMYNHCFEAIIKNGKLVQVERANVSEWESRSKGCAQYVCINETGKSINGTCNNASACYKSVGTCDEEAGTCSYERKEGWSELEKQANQCYEVICDEAKNEWVLQSRGTGSGFTNYCYDYMCENESGPSWRKKDNATEWEAKSDGCYEHYCDNESGFLSRSICSGTCVKGECVQNDNDTWSVVEIVISGVKSSEVDPTQVLNMINQLTSIDIDDFKIRIDADDTGTNVRLLLYVKDEDTANVIVNAVNNLDKGEKCPYGVLCRSKAKFITKSESISNGYQLTESTIILLVLITTTMFESWDI